MKKKCINKIQMVLFRIFYKSWTLLYKLMPISISDSLEFFLVSKSVCNRLVFTSLTKSISWSEKSSKCVRTWLMMVCYSCHVLRTPSDKMTVIFVTITYILTVLFVDRITAFFWTVVMMKLYRKLRKDNTLHEYF